MTAAKPKDKIQTYQAFRGIASLFILFSHMHYVAGSSNAFWSGFWNIFMSRCSILTSFFFLCSGFFLNYTWKKDTSFGKYVKGKLKRIYPITLLVFLMALAVNILLSGQSSELEDAAVGSKTWIFNAVSNLLMLKAFIPHESVFYSFHGPSWYISALFGFYIAAFPFMRGLYSDQKSKWRKIITYVCIGAYAVELVICILQTSIPMERLWLCYVNPWFRIFGECFAGILLCEYMPQIQEKLKRIPVNVLEITGLVLLFGAILIRNIFTMDIFPAWLQNLFPAWLQILFMGSLLPAFRSGTGKCSAVLTKKPWLFLGDISFELYMTHAFVYEGLPIACGFVSKSIKQFMLDNPGTRFIITLILCIIFAWIVHLFMNWLNKKVISKI